MQEIGSTGRVTAVIPALNEAAHIGQVVAELLALRRPDGRPWINQVLVADNGSTDGTASAATAAGALVIEVPQRGYGQACWQASSAVAQGTLLYVDGDGAAAPAEAPRLLAAIEQGADLVIGVREHPDPHSMSAAQRFGNALACALMRWIWRMPARDLGPYRAIRREAFERLDMRDRAFGWTVEMQVRAHLLGLRVHETEVGWHARVAGHSKISGTVRGVVLAGLGILGMIWRLWRQERQRPALATPFIPPNRHA